MKRINDDRMSYYKNLYGSSQQWNGKDNLIDKTVIVYCEQGMGDTIQMARYIPKLKELGCKVIMHCRQPLHRLFNITLDCECIEKDPSNLTIPDHDYNIMSLDLPYLTLNNPIGTFEDWLKGTNYQAMIEINKQIPNLPYIKISNKTDIETTETTIGIAWEGNPEHPKNKERSCHLKHFKALPYKMFMVQNKIYSEELFENNFDLYGVEIKDMLDTAELINSLSCVVSVDSAPLHLAGAMGKPTFGLLDKNPDARWGMKIDKSLWYPSLKLYRKISDWDETLKSVAIDLQSFDFTNAVN